MCFICSMVSQPRVSWVRLGKSSGRTRYCISFIHGLWCFYSLFRECARNTISIPIREKNFSALEHENCSFRLQSVLRCLVGFKAMSVCVFPGRLSPLAKSPDRYSILLWRSAEPACFGTYKCSGSFSPAGLELSGHHDSQRLSFCYANAVVQTARQTCTNA